MTLRKSYKYQSNYSPPDTSSLSSRTTRTSTRRSSAQQPTTRKPFIPTNIPKQAPSSRRTAGAFRRAPHTRTSPQKSRPSAAHTVTAAPPISRLLQYDRTRRLLQTRRGVHEATWPDDGGLEAASFALVLRWRDILWREVDEWFYAW
jgi:hypothetical protein